MIQINEEVPKYCNYLCCSLHPGKSTIIANWSRKSDHFVSWSYCDECKANRIINRIAQESDFIAI